MRRYQRIATAMTSRGKTDTQPVRMTTTKSPESPVQCRAAQMEYAMVISAVGRRRIGVRWRRCRRASLPRRFGR
jgi:hypothetical protein